jgi:hypothetical protein
MTLGDNIKLIIDALGALLIPVVLLFLGQWFIRSKERSDSAIRDAAQLETFLEHLSSENRKRCKLALLALTYMRNARKFPPELLQAVESIAALDDPEIAAAANLALGRTLPQDGLGSDDRALLFELLLPIKVHFDRTRQAFTAWVENKPTKPNIEIEDAIKASNSVIRNILTNKWHLLPADLQKDAMRLIEHYDAWQEEYDRLRPGGVRDPNVPYVFAGPKGVPFPADAEQHFIDRYKKMAAKGDSPGSGA